MSETLLGSPLPCVELGGFTGTAWMDITDFRGLGPCEYVLTWDLCGQHFLKNHGVPRVSKQFPFCFLKEIFKTHGDSTAINSLLSSPIILILIFVGPFLWLKTD